MTPPRRPPTLRLTIKADPVYRQHLGEFIETFAETEAVLFYYFMRSCRIPSQVGRVILAGTRTDQMITYLRSVWKTDSENHPEQEEMTPTLTQMQAINTARGLIVHFASRLTDDGSRISSDLVRTAKMDSPRETSASIETLRAMTADLHRITIHFVTFMANPEAPMALRLQEFPILASAWQYKGPQHPKG